MEIKEAFIFIIQSNLNQLLEYQLSMQMQLNPTESCYLNFIIDYLRGELNIEKTENLSNLEIPEFLKLIIECRYQIQTDFIQNQTQLELAKFLEENILDNTLIHWRGEIAFVLGLTYLEIKSFVISQFYFRLAYKELLELGAKKKAVKSLLNIVVAESRINENKKLIIDYEFVAKKSLEYEDSIVAGICYLNISREFQLVGSLLLALKYSNKSIELLRSDLGTTHFYNAILHRCHLYIDLKRYDEAQLDYELVKACPFPKIQESLKVIHNILGKNEEVNSKILDPTWNGRWAELKNGVSLKQISKLESKLLESLADKSRSKEELMELLYGDKINYMDSENRFKVLISRLRKRHPGLIFFEDGKYKIADEIFLKTESI